MTMNTGEGPPSPHAPDYETESHNSSFARQSTSGSVGGYGGRQRPSVFARTPTRLPAEPSMTHSSLFMRLPKAEFTSLVTPPSARGSPSPPPFWVSALYLSHGLLGTLGAFGLAVLALVLAGGQAEWWAVALFQAWAGLLLLALYVACAVQLHRFVLATGQVVSAGRGPQLPAHSSSVSIRLLSYFHSLLNGKEQGYRVTRGPLDFLEEDLATWARSPNGYTVIDNTGVILWCNTAMLAYFGYEEDELVSSNVRVLMPDPYSRQHDQFLRRHLRTGCRNVLGTCREVPVVSKCGISSVVRLAVHDARDPLDPTSHLFVGRMDFHQEDPLLTTLLTRLKVAPWDLTRMCAPLNSSADVFVVMTYNGLIRFINTAGCQLFQWRMDELQGQNVKVLMGDPYASAHDRFLQTYWDRKAANLPNRGIVGSGRDVMAKVRDGTTVRVFLMVHCMEHPSRVQQEAVFIGKMGHVHTLEPLSLTGDALARRGSHAPPPNAGAARSHPRRPTVHGAALRPVRCTLLAIDVLQKVDGRPQSPYERLLSLLADLCTEHKAVLHSALGNRVVVTFNATLEVPNTSHRKSAASFMLDLEQRWRWEGEADGLPLRMAAVSQHCLCGPCGPSHVVLGEAVDLCSAILDVAHEIGAGCCLIDEALHAELCYSYTCRVVNYLHLHPDQPAEHPPLLVYELIGLREATHNEWMYELEASNPDVGQLKHWLTCWQALQLPRGGSPRAKGVDLPAALHALEEHLALTPDDGIALWLRAVLTSRTAGLLPPALRRTGALMYVPHFCLPSVLDADAEARMGLSGLHPSDPAAPLLSPLPFPRHPRGAR